MMRMIDRARMKAKLNPQEHDAPYQDFPVLFSADLKYDELNAYYLDRYYMSGNVFHSDHAETHDSTRFHADLHIHESPTASVYNDVFIMDGTMVAKEDQQQYGDRVKMKWSDEEDWKTIQ